RSSSDRRQRGRRLGRRARAPGSMDHLERLAGWRRRSGEGAPGRAIRGAELMSRTFEVRWQGASRRVEVRPDGRIVVDGSVAAIEPAGPDAWRVTIDGRTSVVLAAGTPRN